MRHPGSRNLGNNLTRNKSRKKDMRTGDMRCRKQARCGGDVEQGAVMQMDRAFIHAQFGHNIGCVCTKVCMTEHDALGSIGCPAGVEDAGKVIPVAPRIFSRPVVEDKLLIVMTTRWRCPRAAVDHVTHFSIGVRQKRFAHCHEIRPEDNNLRTAIVGLCNNLVQTKPVIERNNDSTRMHGGIETFQRTVAVQCNQHNPAARLKP